MPRFHLEIREDSRLIGLGARVFQVSIRTGQS